MGVVGALRGFVSREPLLSALLLLLPVVLVVVGPVRFLGLVPRVLDVDALCLIVCLMLVSRGLELSGLLSLVAGRILGFVGGRGSLAVVVLVVVCGLSAAIVMNDASLFVYVPLARALAGIMYVGEEYLVVLMAMAANIGSSLTPIGNPQNIIIWRYSGVGFARFVSVMSWFVVPSMLLLSAYAWLLARRVGAVGRFPVPPPVRPRRGLAAVSCILLVLAVVLAEVGLQPLALAAALTVYALLYPEVLRGFDYALVAVFALMFVDFGALARILSTLGVQVPRGGPGLYLASVTLSQLVSNVPATILLVGLHAEWRVLALGVNVAGVGFILGSLANIIAVRLSRAGVGDYHRVALPFFVVLAALYGLLVWAAGFPPRL